MSARFDARGLDAEPPHVRRALPPDDAPGMIHPGHGAVWPREVRLTDAEARRAAAFGALVLAAWVILPAAGLAAVHAALGWYGVLVGAGVALAFAARAMWARAERL